MASLFRGLSKAFWGAFSKPSSRKQNDEAADQRQDEELNQASRKRPLEDQTSEVQEPNKKTLLYRLDGGPEYIGQDFDTDEGQYDGRFEDAEDQLSDEAYVKEEDDAEGQLFDNKPYIKTEEAEYLHRTEHAIPVSENYDLSTLFTTPERQARRDDTIIRDQLQSAMAKRIWIGKALEQRAKDAENLRDQGFSEDTVSIHQKIGMRGMIPCFPSTWAYTLNTLDRIHFTDQLSEAFVSSLSDRDFRAAKAFQRLMGLGAWARDAVTNEEHTSPNRKPEKLVQKEITAYIKWAFKDGLIDNDLTPPTIGVYSAPINADLKEFQKQVTLDLFAMKQVWRAKLHEESLVQAYDFEGMVPDVYGIAIVDTEVRFVVLHDWHEEPQVIIWSCLDFASLDHDFWNAQAVALLVVHCRNNMVDLEEILHEDPGEHDAATSAAPP